VFQGGRMKLSIFLITVLVFAVSCSSANKSVRGVSKIADTTKYEKNVKNFTALAADSVLKKYTIEFDIPNPLFGDDGTGMTRRFDPSHTATIDVWARLLDDYSTEADIAVKCKKDSLSTDDCVKFAENYRNENHCDKMFRITLFMESGFSEKSLEPKLWSMYIEDAGGVTIEPVDIKAGPVTTLNDSVYNSNSDRFVNKRVFRRNLTLFFKKNTFYGENLLGDKNTKVVFTISRERKKIEKVAWKLFSTEKIKK
jgi:hypothetical protein